MYCSGKTEKDIADLFANIKYCWHQLDLVCKYGKLLRSSKRNTAEFQVKRFKLNVNGIMAVFK